MDRIRDIPGHQACAGWPSMCRWSRGVQRDIKQLAYALLLKGRAFLFALRNPPVIGEPFRNQLPARPELDAKIKRLITKSWGPSRNGQHKGFDFAANLNTNANSLEQYTTAMLHHIRRVAPILNVPWLTPRVTITSLTSAAGRFVEEDGWVRIEVDQNFLLKPAAAKAILCHEVCHYD